ncbi:MAG TPA: ATP-binding protein [Candidatus Tectomicrobia bacterium]|jgi:PAS domain S-box-containing protein
MSKSLQVAQALENSELFNQMQRLQEQYRVVTETLHDAVYVVDQEGHMVFANAALERLTGYSKTELLGQPSIILYTPDVVPEVLQRRREALSGEYVPPYTQTQFRHKNGQCVPVEISAATLFQAGRTVGRVIVARDMTERLHLETQLRRAQKMEAMGALAGEIAHDFNNILTAMLGYTELTLGDISPGSRAWRNLQEVWIAGQRAKALVQQILTCSRQTEPERQPLQLHLLVREVLKLLRAALPTTIEIRQELDENAGMVLADSTQIHQVLMNLCTNAGHAMQQTGGVLTICLSAYQVAADTAPPYPDMAPGPYLRLTVQDTGHGMTPEILERIFEPFFTTKSVGEGTGMGLAVVHGIVTSHGGAVTVDSTPGQGTTVVVYLPCSTQDPMAAASPEAPITTGNECVLLSTRC